MGIIVYNNLSSQDYGILVEHPPVYQMPEKDYEMIHVDGRNGDILIDKGSFQNVERKYEIAFADKLNGYVTGANKIATWLNVSRGYNRLEDSYEPEYYRIAAFMNGVDLTNIKNKAGRATITFNCKPQRFLKTGEKVLKLQSGDIVRNPTEFEAEPIFKLYLKSTEPISSDDSELYWLTIRNANVSAYVPDLYDVKITLKGGSVPPNIFVIDSISMACYSGIGSTSYNGKTVMYNGFPKLPGGELQINFSDNIDHVELTPNWWTL